MFIACSTTMGSAMGTAEVLEAVARLGFDEVDILGIHQWAPHIQPEGWLADPDQAKFDLDQLLEQNKLKLKSLNIGLSTELYDRSEAAIKVRHEELTAYLRVMKAYGLSVISLQPGKYPEGEADYFPDYVKTIKEITALEKEAGVTIALELHVGSPVGQLADANRLLEAVPDLSIIYDPSHFAMQRIALKDTLPLIHRTAHVHVRDAAPDKLQVPYGTGTVDFGATWQVLKDHDYSGGFSIEYIMTDEWDIGPEILKGRDDIKRWFE